MSTLTSNLKISCWVLAGCPTRFFLSTSDFLSSSVIQPLIVTLCKLKDLASLGLFVIRRSTVILDWHHHNAMIWSPLHTSLSIWWRGSYLGKASLSILVKFTRTRFWEWNKRLGLGPSVRVYLNPLSSSSNTYGALAFGKTQTTSTYTPSLRSVWHRRHSQIHRLTHHWGAVGLSSAHRDLEVCLSSNSWVTHCVSFHHYHTPLNDGLWPRFHEPWWNQPVGELCLANFEP